MEFVTFHGSKGLEYKIVWIVDANEEITPHSKAILLRKFSNRILILSFRFSKMTPFPYFL